MRQPLSGCSITNGRQGGKRDEVRKTPASTANTRSPMLRKSKAIFQLRRYKITHSTKKQSDIPAPQAQDHPFHGKGKRYFDYTCTRSPIPQKSKAIFRLHMHKVTRAAKKQSDISAPQAQDHPFHKKAKRYSRSANTRSPVPRKSKAIFRLCMHKVTHSTKKQSDISDTQARGYSCCEKGKRYFDYTCTRSLIPQKNKAIFRLHMHKVTHSTIKQSDISAPQARAYSLGSLALISRKKSGRSRIFPIL